jgi:hypothetical protein
MAVAESLTRSFAIVAGLGRVRSLCNNAPMTAASTGKLCESAPGSSVFCEAMAEGPRRTHCGVMLTQSTLARDAAQVADD